MKIATTAILTATWMTFGFCSAAEDETKAIRAVLKESIAAYASKDKASVFKFFNAKTVFTARKEGETHASLSTSAKAHFEKKEQSSFENNCNSLVRAQTELLEIAPKVMVVPKGDPRAEKQLSSIRYPNEPEDQATRIGAMEKLAEVRGKRANVKLVKVNGSWLICFD